MKAVEVKNNEYYFDKEEVLKLDYLVARRFVDNACCPRLEILAAFEMLKDAEHFVTLRLPNDTTFKVFKVVER